ncbi:hypothetical protein [Bacteroides salyersiae]|uniref:hypothetical protein n=1 Tax=Bacteroides salyersiae TaxID=291644 RepID=UPI001C8BE26E|nr:hypothetical protein [Bacteroides salyersiae]
MIQGEDPPRFPGNRAHHPYARYPPPVCLMLTTHMHGTWKTFAQRSESGNTPSPCIADEQSSEAKKVKPVKGVKNTQKRHSEE